MDHSLINPNQIRFNEIDVMDDPFGEPEAFGIQHEDCFIPFELEGTTVYFDTTCPTDGDLENYEHVVLTSSDPWDPREVDLRRGSKPDAQQSAMLPHGDKRSMKQMAAAELPPYQHESDLILGSISAGLVADQAEERAYDAIKVEGNSRSIQEMASEERHSRTTPERVSKLFGIGLNKAHQLLRVTSRGSPSSDNDESESLKSGAINRGLS